jgi:SEC-C motif-containing protein
MNCPCGNEKEFSQCCEPFLKGEATPDTAEKLMRSRYTAFTLADMEYVKRTLAPEARKGFDVASSKEAAKQAKWKGLKILSTKAGGPDDDEGIVEFTATYEHAGEGVEHHEVSEFRKEDGEWFFVDGDAHTHREGEGHQHHHTHERPVTVVREAPKVGRNDPCSCGSGKKFKKCCGAAA